MRMVGAVRGDDADRDVELDEAVDDLLRARVEHVKLPLQGRRPHDAGHLAERAPLGLVDLPNGGFGATCDRIRDREWEDRDAAALDHAKRTLRVAANVAPLEHENHRNAVFSEPSM